MSNNKLNQITKEHTFTRDNRFDTIIDKDKDYFAFTDENDEKYSFYSPKRFLNSKLLFKSFLWSSGIGSAIFLHRYFRTKSFTLALKWGTLAMYGSFFFTWAMLEYQPFIMNFFQSKQLDQKRNNQIAEISKKNYLNKKEKDILDLKRSNLDFFISKREKIFVNSDYYARCFLDGQDFLLRTFCNEQLELKYIIKVIFKLNPFLDENAINQVDIADDFDTEEEEFYLNEIDEVGKDKYKIKSIWIDYAKLNDFNYFNEANQSFLSFDKRSELINNESVKILLDKDINELSNIEHDLKDLLTIELDMKNDLLKRVDENIEIAKAVLKDPLSEDANIKNTFINN